MINKNKGDYLSKTDIVKLFLKENESSVELLLFGQTGLKTVRLNKEDIQMISENPENFRLIDIKLKQKASNKKKSRSYLIRIIRPANNNSQQVLVLLSGAKRKIKGLS